MFVLQKSLVAELLLLLPLPLHLHRPINSMGRSTRQQVAAGVTAAPGEFDRGWGCLKVCPCPPPSLFFSCPFLSFPFLSSPLLYSPLLSSPLLSSPLLSSPLLPSPLLSSPTPPLLTRTTLPPFHPARRAQKHLLPPPPPRWCHNQRFAPAFIPPLPPRLTCIPPIPVP